VADLAAILTTYTLDRFVDRFWTTFEAVQAAPNTRCCVYHGAQIVDNYNYFWHARGCAGRCE
jgi:hypothetical protein